MTERPSTGGIDYRTGYLKMRSVLHDRTTGLPTFALQFDRLRTQLKGAIDLMEAAVAERQSGEGHWLLGTEVGQADISTAVAWRFSQHIDRAQIKPDSYPALSDYSTRAEELPEFRACPLSG